MCEMVFLIFYYSKDRVWRVMDKIDREMHLGCASFCLTWLSNGSTSHKFHIQCGLRQGCPLSPLLFNLVVESFTISVKQF